MDTIDIFNEVASADNEKLNSMLRDAIRTNRYVGQTYHLYPSSSISHTDFDWSCFGSIRWLKRVVLCLVHENEQLQKIIIDHMWKYLPK